jgi:hypothetical protein
MHLHVIFLRIKDSMTIWCDDVDSRNIFWKDFDDQIFFVPILSPTKSPFVY